MRPDRAALISHYAFPLDPFQERALDALDEGNSVLVAAPTGSGKTVVAEYAVDVAVAEGRRAFYTAPIKALSNQKFKDLAARLGADQVGLLTGDNSINGDAPVVVMTTEVLRNMIYARSAGLADLAMVVNYGADSLEDERLPNYLRDKHVEFAWQPEPIATEWLYGDLTNEILRACHRVHFTLGPGFLHQVYRRATMIELQRMGVNFTYVKQLSVEYAGQHLGFQPVRLILVDNKVLLATFAVQTSAEALGEQLKARMRQLGVKLGILANFHDVRLQVTPVRLP